jgi:hypothetical protein
MMRHPYDAVLCGTMMLMDTVARRASLPLTDQDLADLARLREPEGPWLRRLRAHAGEEKLGSEAAILHAVWAVGIERLREEILDEGYAALAASYDDPGERENEAALRRRKRRHHDDRDEG